MHRTKALPPKMYVNILFPKDVEIFGLYIHVYVADLVVNV